MRPEIWNQPAGESPVPVGTGAPGSRLQFVGEIRRAERGVKSLCGGSKSKGRSDVRVLQPRHIYNGGAEPFISRRRPRPADPWVLECDIRNYFGEIFHGVWPLLERGIRRYYLHRWPSQRSTKRVRQKVHDLTGRNRNGVTDVRVLIRDLNPILRGRGNYFRTGNAASTFISIDRYVWKRLCRFLVKRHSRNLHAGRADQWTDDWFKPQGLYRLRGTIRYSEAA